MHFLYQVPHLLYGMCVKIFINWDESLYFKELQHENTIENTIDRQYNEREQL